MTSGRVQYADVTGSISDGVVGSGRGVEAAVRETVAQLRPDHHEDLHDRRGVRGGQCLLYL